jgi:EAL domain-containing protein (putative c-di-GMP-specific phosphodiesterase class I)
LETDLRQAIEQRHFRLHYQPIYSLAEGRIVELEALLRWQRPGYGLVPPGDFIGVAEETGIIVPIGRWVIEEACRQLAEWHAQFPTEPPLTVSVNLSARQFQHRELVADIQRALAAVNLAPRYLKLEITESTAMLDAEATVAKLRTLKDLGVQLAIDDFGTGYSSLAYLKRFPIDSLKIDRSFVDAVGHDVQDTAIVQCVVALAKTLRLNVTGEGVENEDQATHLRGLGCQRGQGYLFARPLPAAQITELVAAEPGFRDSGGPLLKAA